MKSKLLLPFLFLLFAGQFLMSQAPPAEFLRPSFSTTAGYNGTLPGARACHDFETLLGSTLTPNSQGEYDLTTEFATALGNLPTRAGTLEVVKFPAGVYNLTQQVNISRSNVIIKGAGSNKTTFNWLGDTDTQGRGNLKCFNVLGPDPVAAPGSLPAEAVAGSSTFTVPSGGSFPNGAWVVLFQNDPDNGEGGCNVIPGAFRQVSRVVSRSGNTITTDNPFRMNYRTADGARAVVITAPVVNVGFECFKVDGSDNPNTNRNEGTNQANIFIQRAYNCWIEGVDSRKAVYNHFVLDESSNIEIRGCHASEALLKNGGHSYGVTLQQGTGECLIENNIFNKCRHSVVIQKAANGNVIAYNYSANSTDFDNSDLILHGGWPFANLLEGNVCQRIHLDLKDCINGPGNLLFRNRVYWGTNQMLAPIQSGRRISFGIFGYNIKGAQNLCSIGNQAWDCPNLYTRANPVRNSNFLPFWCRGRGGSGNIGTSVAYTTRPGIPECL